MEINSNYIAKTIQKADNATNGKGANVDNFADLLSNIVDDSKIKPNTDNADQENNNKKEASNQNDVQTSIKAQNPTEAQNTTEVQNPTDVQRPNEIKPSPNGTQNNFQMEQQNNVIQPDTQVENVIASIAAPIVAKDDKPINDNSNINTATNDEPKTDGEKNPQNNPLVDAQQAMLALILSQGQQPIANAAPNAAAESDIIKIDTNNVITTNNVVAATAKTLSNDFVQGPNNPAIVAALAHNSDANELKTDVLTKESGKTTDAKGAKADVAVKTADANIANDVVKTDTVANNVQNTNQDKNPNNLLVKNNVTHQQTQTSDAGSKTQDLLSSNANTLAATDNSLTANNNATTTDVNKSAADQNSGLRINLDNIQSLAAIMVRKHFSGERTFTIRLDPPELGEIKVELKIDKDKKAKAIISASNNEALGDLTKSVKELTQSLKDGGVDISEEDFEFNLNQQSKDNEFAENSKSQSNNKASEKNNSKDVQSEIISQINNDQFSNGINRTQIWHNVRVSLIA